MSNELRTIVLILTTALTTVFLVYLINPILPEQLSLGVTTETVAPVSVAEGVTLTFDVPTDEEVAIATSFDTETLAQEIVLEDVTAPLPLVAVSEEYAAAFNDLITEVARLEVQLNERVAPALLAVQEKAAAKDFIAAFEYMVIARTELAEFDTMLIELNNSLAIYRRSYTVPGMSTNVRANSEALDRALVVFHREATTFSGLMKESVNGQIPSQELVDKLEASNRQVLAAAEEVTKSITELTAAIRDYTEQTSN